MKTTRIHLLPGIMLACGLVVQSTAGLADETNHWSFDVSLYGVAAGMSGDVRVESGRSHRQVMGVIRQEPESRCTPLR